MAATLRKYLSVKPASGSGSLHEATKTITVAHNRLGGAITYMGQQVIDFKEVFNIHRDFTLDYFKSEQELLQKEHEFKQELIEKKTDILGRKKGLEQDKKAEEQQEKVTDKQAKDQGKKLAKKEKKKFGWFKVFFDGLKPVFEVIAQYVTMFAAYQFMDWLSDPKNKKAIETITRFVGALWSFSRKLTEFGINNVMDGITRVFTDDPTKEGVEEVFDDMFGVLQIIGGLAGLWAASRVLMPWKLIGDVKFMTSLGRAVSVAEQTDGGGKKGKPKRKPNRRPKARQKPQAKPKAKAPKVSPKGKGIFGRTFDGLRNIGSKAKKGIVQAGSAVKNVSVGAINFIGDKAKGLWSGAKEFAGSAWKQGEKIAKSIGNLAELAKDPKKLGQIVKTKLKESLKGVVEKNDTIKKITDVAKNPKGKGKKLIVDLFKGAIKNPGFKNFREFLGGVKANFKIGGIDTVIAALMGLLDYGMFGESPINAIVNALAGLLGYSAGFAIGAPFGGVPGFITGAAGAFAGEWIGNKLLEGLGDAFPNLLEIEDPVAKMIAESGEGKFNEMFKNRKLLRDPSTEMPGFEEAAKQELAAGGSIHPYLTKMDDQNIKKAYAPIGRCVTGSLDTMLKSGVPEPAATGNDVGNNPRGAISQLMQAPFNWKSMGGASKTLNSPYGTVQAGVYTKNQYGELVSSGKVPSGALVFQSRYNDWNGTAKNSSGYDMAIAQKGGREHWNGQKMPQYVYGGSTKKIIVLTPNGKKGDGKSAPIIGKDESTSEQITPGEAPSGTDYATGSTGVESSSVAGETTPKPPSKPMTAMEAFSQVGGLDMLNSFLGDIGESDLGRSGFGTSPSPVATPTEIKQEESLINTKSSQLATASADKVRRDKQQGQANTAVLMYRQQIGVPGPPGAQVVKSSPSPSPLVIK